MSNQYPFSENDNYKNESVLDSAVLVEDGVVWDQEEEVQVSLNYSNDPDETLTENHSESFLTANESSNDTHYFSVLETTNETILNNLSDIAVGCTDPDTTEVPEEQQPIVNSICTIGGQPDIYRIEGSDDLCAFEVAYDQEGNIQRFRYRLRLNENGEYESVPESIELLPLEHESEGGSNVSPAEIPQQEQEGDDSQTTVKVFVKQELLHEQETILPDIPDAAEISNPAEDSSDELQVNEDEAGVSDEEQTDTVGETKTGILEQSLLAINKEEAVAHYKAETFEETFFENANHDDHHCSENDAISASVHDAEVTENFNQIAISNPNADNTDDTSTTATVQDPEHSSFEQILMAETHEPEEASNEVSSADPKQVEKPFAPESDDSSDGGMDSAHSEDDSEEHFENTNVDNMPYLDDLNENESDTDDYQIVDGVHVTADTETHDDASNVIEHFLQREPSLQHQILKIQQQIPVLQSTTANDDKLKEMVVNNNFNKVNKGFTYYVVKHPEKENVAAIAHHPVANKIVKANPRSLLKSSYFYYDQKKENEKPSVQKIEKKLVKNKEAMQAKFLHNFIAKTTILHAPVRQQRLPRKQTIKPVERADEEIIVQEVVVSSNGFIETSEDGVVKSKVPLKPTEIVQLSDSDDDYDPKKEHKRKKKQKKRKSKVTEIVISDSEEEDGSDDDDDDVVQIDLSDSDEEVNDDDDKNKGQSIISDVVVNKSRRSTRKSSVASGETKNPEPEQSSSQSSQGLQSPVPLQSQKGSNDGGSGLKKKRGRPPKRRNSTINDETSITDGSTSSSKKQRRNTKDSVESSESNESKSEERAAVESAIQTIKTKWKCTKCPKTFPSQGSLKTHMQYHNFHEPNSRNLRQSTKPEEAAFKKPESTTVVAAVAVVPAKNKYECARCGETFKNNFLLTRHIKVHESGASKSLECSICKKPFADRAQLINHKRTHVKEQMFNSTTLPKHSPKSTTLAKAKSVNKSPKKAGQLKCNYCTKVFTSLPLLNAHARTHKRFTCTTCPASFISKLALEDHIRHNCVKQTKSPVRRLSLKTRKSFLAPPQRVSKRLSQRKSTGKKSSNVSVSNNSSSSDKEKKKLGASLACDTCSITFASHKALFRHKVVKHGYNTPDKSILTNSANRKTLHKESGMHSSVPASERLRNAFGGIKTKLDY